MNTYVGESTLSFRFWGSQFMLKIAMAMIFFIILTFCANWWEKSSAGTKDEAAYFNSVLTEWQEEYPDKTNLFVADFSTIFHKTGELYSQIETAILTPVGANLEGFQEILEIASYPPMLRQFEVDGITCLAWEYPGSYNRDITARAIVLVRQNPSDPVKTVNKQKTSEPIEITDPMKTSEPIEASEPSTFLNLPESIKHESTATVVDLQEHQLHRCALFESWVTENAGEGPILEQYLNIMSVILTHIFHQEENNHDDICKSLRKNEFTSHRGHVLAVMAARELGIPSFGCAGAEPGFEHMVTLYTDQTGWIFVNMDDHQPVYLTSVPVIVTLLPLMSQFEGSYHDFWYPASTLPTSSSWGIYASGCTQWQTPNEESANVTRANTYPLSDYKFAKTLFPTK